MAEEKIQEPGLDLSDPIYRFDGEISLKKAVPFGLQHVLAMFVANIAPILIVTGAVKMPTEQAAALIQAAMIMAGVGSLFQMFPVGPLGSRLPIIMGISFTFVSTFCVIGAKYGYGANSFGGGFGNPHFGEAPYMIVGTVTLVSCLVFNIKAKSFYKQLSVLFGLIVGYITAFFYGMVDLSKIGSAGLFSLPQPLPYALEFHPDAIFSVFLIFLVSATETLGDTSALTVMGFGRNATDKEIEGSIGVDGFISALSSLFGCLPITSFSQNVGLIAMTHVVNRKAVASGAVIMILAGLFPVLGVILASLPEAVLGGCTLMMFGSIVVSGVRMLGSCGYSQRNMIIAALSLSIGIGFTQNPAIFKIFPDLMKSVFAENCVAVVFVVAVVLNLILPEEMK